MKKIFTFLNVIALGAVVASCNLNSVPVFDDANAFVELGITTVMVAENDGTVEIPVTLASLAGVEELVTYETVDGTAKAGVDFTLADPTATLTFDAENRIQIIKINIIEHAGEYTGDLSFEVKLAATGSVSAGMITSCKVTIADNDHPLAAILGNYDAASLGYNKEELTWTLTITKDPDDVTIVHVSSMVAGFAASAGDYSIAGVVNEEQDKITFAPGQLTKSTYKSDTDFWQVLTWEDGIYLDDEEEIVFTKVAEGKWTCDQNIWYYPVETEKLYVDTVARGPITWTKK